MRQHRHSDGGGGSAFEDLPPLGAARKKGSRRRKGSLHTTSAPLTPQAGVHGVLDPRANSATEQQQQQPQHRTPAALLATPSRLGQRSTYSDTGQTRHEPCPPETAAGGQQQAQRQQRSGGQQANRNSTGSGGSSSSGRKKAGQQQHSTNTLGKGPAVQAERPGLTGDWQLVDNVHHIHSVDHPLLQTAIAV